MDGFALYCKHLLCNIALNDKFFILKRLPLQATGQISEGWFVPANVSLYIPVPRFSSSSSSSFSLSGDPRNCGAQVRIGDKHTENAPKEFSRYLRQLRQLPPTDPEIRTVFLATDEPRIVEQVQAPEPTMADDGRPWNERTPTRGVADYDRLWLTMPN